MENCQIIGSCLQFPPGIKKLNWEQMSSHTGKMILLVNVSLNETHYDKNGSLVDSKSKEKNIR